MDESAATVSVAGSQETVMVGAIGSCLDLRSVSEWSLEPRGENEGICSVGTASVCEGVDIEIDSGAEVSCLPSNIGADTYPLHETRLSMCGGHHVAAGGEKLNELGARILGLETDDVRGNMVNLLVRFRVMEIGKALLSTRDLSRCGWETVFPAGCGDAYLIRKASNTRITLVKKRCAWYLRAKVKPHHELPLTKDEEFLEVMSMDQGAGVWPVFEGGSSSSSGPMVPEGVEESTPVKKLVTLSAPTAEDREEHIASGDALFRTWCRECCIGRGRMHQHRAGGRETAIPAIAIDYGYLNDRDDQVREAGAPILVSKCDRDRWIGAAIVPTKGADEYSVAELKNDVMCNGFTEVLVRSDNEPSIFALKESTTTALKLAGVTIKAEESALYDSQSNGMAENDAVRTNLACLVRRFGQDFTGEHPVLSWLVKYSEAMVNRYRRGPDGKTAYVAQGAQIRKGTAVFFGEDSLHYSWGHKGCCEN